jgi:hypothetical protein
MRRRSAQLTTWEWLERQIARQIKARQRGRLEPKAFSQLLAKRLKAGSDPKPVAKGKTFKEH